MSNLTHKQVVHLFANNRSPEREKRSRTGHVSFKGRELTGRLGGRAYVVRYPHIKRDKTLIKGIVICRAGDNYGFGCCSTPGMHRAFSRDLWESITPALHPGTGAWGGGGYIYRLEGKTPREMGKRMLHEYEVEYFNDLDRSSRARENAPHLFSSATQKYLYAKRIAELLHLPMWKLECPERLDALRSKVERFRLAAEVRRAKDEERREKARVEEQIRHRDAVLETYREGGLIDQWRSGTEVSLRGQAFRYDEEMLAEPVRVFLAESGVSTERIASLTDTDKVRIKPSDPTTMETTRGAEIKVAHVRRLINRIIRPAYLNATPPPPPIERPDMVVGGYRGFYMNADGTIRIGCHKFNRAEVERVIIVIDNLAVAPEEESVPEENPTN